MRHKRPAVQNIGIDLDPAVINAWANLPEDIIKTADAPRGEIGSNITKMEVRPRAKSTRNSKIDDTGSGTASTELSSGDDKQFFTFINDDASSFLKRYRFTGNEFVYVDPPYLMETRKGGKLYNFEYTTQDHVDLLNILKTLPCMVMVSGYWSPLYSSMLPAWNTHSFEAQTRQGPATEWLWFNYPEPEELHDYSYLGETFRERERIKKKRDRWILRILNTPVLERNALFKELSASLPAASTKTMVRACTCENDGAAASSKRRMAPGDTVKSGGCGSGTTG